MNALTQRSMARHSLAALALALGLLQSPPAVSQAGLGLWQLGPNLPFFPVHMHVLPNGNVMMWPGDGGVSGNDPRMWNVQTGAIISLSRPGFDVFCSAHNYLPDGRLFVSGGHISNSVGLPDASIYNPFNNTWAAQPPMNQGRWYPTSTMLAGGEVLVVSGDIDLSQGVNPLPQVWQAATGTWRDLNNARLSQPLYPYLFLAPNGRVFDAGPSVETRYLDTTGAGAWSFVARRTFDASRHYGGAVMYEPGKILLAGGGNPPTNTTEIIDLNSAAPTWRPSSSMAVPRVQMNTTMLPDGKVLVTGGTSGLGWNDPEGAVFTAEVWDPANERWTTLASANTNYKRLYHSIAMLLPDARVFMTGGNGYLQSEIFSPPYLFTGTRPTIDSAPSSVGKGQTFFVAAPNATAINSVAWVRLPSVTHTNAMNQAFFRSTAIAQAAGGINIVAPNHTSVPSGHYMLFVLASGVPSVARVVQLTPAVGNPVPTLSSISPSSARTGDPGFTLTANGGGFIASSKVRWNGAERPTTFVSATRLTAAILASDLAVRDDAQVTVVNPTPGGGTSGAQRFKIRGGQ